MKIRVAYRKGQHLLLNYQRAEGYRWAVLNGITSQKYMINDPSPSNEAMISPNEINFAMVFVNNKCRSSFILVENEQSEEEANFVFLKR